MTRPIHSLLLLLAAWTFMVPNVLAEEAVIASPEQTQASPIHSQQPLLDRPLLERYILDELKALRTEQQDLERRMVVEITDRELSVADKSLNYANVTINYFFYLIAAVASVVAVIGWQSIKDIKVNTKELADKRLTQMTQEYEKKFLSLERELRRKTRIITENNREIEIINEVQKLWLRSQNAPTPEQKIAIYDELLKIRPGDLEALTYKADAAIEMREYHWAMSICNKVLEVDDKNAHAFFQRACAYAQLGVENQAIYDLQQAVEYSSSFRERLAEEPDLEPLHGNEWFDSVIDAESSDKSTS
ncbi:hypothetical protein [Vibrio sp. qd031]|uniref:tetratricopeptide repeat protein n=1 Tax=Vibrio sp. qd031 TaxID=1603038 RepID=UPI00117F08B6|nr:hypothetical protein [Vibrio sp. qd031]